MNDNVKDKSVEMFAKNRKSLNHEIYFTDIYVLIPQ